MKLRDWQSECIDSAILKYQGFKKHVLALATPGAGKTFMASVLAKRLHEQGLIDLVMCFSPSSVVSSDFSESLVEQFGTHFDGTIGALGDSFTYQKLSSISDKTWRLFEKYRVFVIFDEIHHCAGSCDQDANSWGSKIIDKIKDEAEFTIALTGTPWRSDSLPIALSSYCNHSGKILCDYVYGLKKAIKDDVCRVPQIIAVDNDNIKVIDDVKQKSFDSFIELLSQDIISYTEVVTNDLVIEQMLQRSIIKLDEIREINVDAAGLVVASSIDHANKIKQVMRNTFGRDAIVVTSSEIKPNAIISEFRKSEDKWLISVGMVSEGTNIPRLQVCCNLTNIKTEMYFRQILGRILRKTDAVNQEAYMFIPAEPSLVEYTYRVAQDIPEGLSKVKFIKMDGDFTTDVTNVEKETEETKGESDDENVITNEGDDTQKKKKTKEVTEPFPIGEPEVFERIIGIFGKFKHEHLEIEDFELYQISNHSMAKLNTLNAINL